MQFSSYIVFEEVAACNLILTEIFSDRNPFLYENLKNRMPQHQVRKQCVIILKIYGVHI